MRRAHLRYNALNLRSHFILIGQKTFSLPLKVIFDVPYIHLMYSIPLSMFFIKNKEKHILHAQEPFIVN